MAWLLTHFERVLGQSGGHPPSFIFRVFDQLNCFTSVGGLMTICFVVYFEDLNAQSELLHLLAAIFVVGLHGVDQWQIHFNKNFHNCPEPNIQSAIREEGQPIILIPSSQLNSKTMTHLEQNNHSLPAFELSYPAFTARFQEEEVVEDLYLRYYDICQDLQKKEERVAVRRYSTDSEDKLKDVLQNLESYWQLGQMPGICSLVGFTLTDNRQEILAAFEYNNLSLAQVVRSSHFLDQRTTLYFIILGGLASLAENAQQFGIAIQELIPENILLERVPQGYTVKLLYDEREKNYDQVCKGRKAYVSPERVAGVLEIGEESPVGEKEGVFQMGLLLLDLMQDYEFKARAAFCRDSPLSRSRQCFYLVFKDTSVRLNQELVEQQTKFLRSLEDPIVGKLVDLVEKMICQESERVNTQDLIAEIQTLQTQFENTSKNQNSVHSRSQLTVHSQFIKTEQYSQHSAFLDDKKEDVIDLQTQHRQGTVQQSASIQDPGDFKKDPLVAKEGTILQKGVITQTTIETENKQKSQDTLQLSPRREGVKVEERKRIRLPKEQFLEEGKWHSSVTTLLLELINQLEEKGFVVKDYYDKSQYFGQVETTTQKREGKGMYVYPQGDIYFGTWQQNFLQQGHYLFRNGESFSGTVKKGKQGSGTYRYANGNVYQGDWKDDLKDGQGTMAYPNGDLYQGQWRGGKKEGQGTYRYSSGAVYTGAFVNGKKQGLGLIVFPEGTKVEAIWNQTYVEGSGKVFYSNGNYFEGTYHRSEKQGKGLYVWEDSKYEGTFEKDAMEGTARISFSEEEWYEGRIKNGRRCGQGTYRYPNGDVFQGQWRQDQKLYGRYRFAEGSCFQGRFKQGEMSYGVMVYENGESYEGEFSGGQRQGTGTYRDKEGHVVQEGRWQRDEFLSSF